MVMARRLQHSPMLGQLADSQTVELLAVDEVADLEKGLTRGQARLDPRRVPGAGLGGRFAVAEDGKMPSGVLCAVHYRSMASPKAASKAPFMISP